MSLIQNLSTIRLVLNQIAPGTKPASLTIPGGTLSTPAGKALTVVPDCTSVSYATSTDGSGYVITLTGAAIGTIVQFDSESGQIISQQ